MLNLQRYRIEKNMSISALSRLSGVSRAYITQLERELYQNPTLDVIIKLSKGLGITPNQLIKEELYRI